MYLDELGIARCASPIFISLRPYALPCKSTPGHVFSIMCPRMRQQVFQALVKDLSSILEPVLDTLCAECLSFKSRSLAFSY